MSGRDKSYAVSSGSGAMGRLMSKIKRTVSESVSCQFKCLYFFVRCLFICLCISWIIIMNRSMAVAAPAMDDFLVLQVVFVQCQFVNCTIESFVRRAFAASLPNHFRHFFSCSIRSHCALTFWWVCNQSGHYRNSYSSGHHWNPFHWKFDRYLSPSAMSLCSENLNFFHFNCIVM